MDEHLIKKARKLFSDKCLSIVIVTHTNPDGDAIGSSLALYNCFLLAGYDNLSVIIPNADPEFLHWMANHDKLIVAEKEINLANGLINNADILVFLDFNTPGRAENLKDQLTESRAKKVMVDHHPDPWPGFDLCISNTGVSSTAELVYEFIVNLGLQEYIDLHVAECLYCGIVTDTGSFSYASNQPRTYEIMARIMELGVDGARLHRMIYSTYSETRLRLLGYCLSEKLVVLPNENTAYISLSRKELNRFNHQVGDTEGIVNYALSIQGIKLAALFTEQKDHIKISFRSTGSIDVNSFARNHFNGGGHTNASGGKSFDTMDNTLSAFINKIKEHGKSVVTLLIILAFFVLGCNRPSEPEKNLDRKQLSEMLEAANVILVDAEKQDIDDFIKRYGWEMKETGSGLRYMIYEKGDGPAAATGKTASIHYSIHLLNGDLVYSSDQEGAKLFRIGQGGVESGLEEGILLLHVGDKARFIMPSHLAHGVPGDGIKIPRRSAIVFSIELLDLF